MPRLPRAAALALSLALLIGLVAGLIQSVSQGSWPGLAAWVELSGLAPALCLKPLLPQPIST